MNSKTSKKFYTLFFYPRHCAKTKKLKVRVRDGLLHSLYLKYYVPNNDTSLCVAGRDGHAVLHLSRGGGQGLTGGGGGVDGHALVLVINHTPM